MKTNLLHLKKTVATLAILLAAVAGAQAQTLPASGTVNIASNMGFSSDVTLTGNLTLNLSDNAMVTVSGVISGPLGSITVSGSGVLILTGNNTYRGITTINPNCMVTIGNTSGAIAGRIANNGALQFDRINDYTYTGVISGSGDLYKSRTTKVILTGNNTYTGQTIIHGGTLQVGDGVTANSSIGGTSNVNIDADAVLRFEPGSDMVFDKVISGDGSVEYNSSKDLYLTANNTYTGTTTTMEDGGVLWIGNNTTTGSLGAGDVIHNSSWLTFYRSNDYTCKNNISGGGNLGQYGNAKLILTGNNTYTKQTVVFTGTLQVGDGTSGNLSGTSDVDLRTSNSILRFEPGGNMTFDKVISGAGSVEYKGSTTKTLHFTANNTYTGTTTIEAGGDFYIGANTTTGAVAGNVIVDAPGYLNFQRSNAYTYSGVISGTGGVTQQGTGVFTMSANHTASGAFNQIEGTVKFSGNWAGSFSKNTAGTLEIVGNANVDGNLTLDGGNMVMDLTTATPAKLTVGGSVSTFGTTTLNITAPNTAANYILMQANSGGITDITPYTLNLTGVSGGTLSVNAPTQLKLSTSPTGIDDVSLPTMQIYPNPCTTTVLVENAAGSDLSVMDMTGKLVLHQNKISDSQEIPVGNLNPGVYLFNLTKDGLKKAVIVVKK